MRRLIAIVFALTIPAAAALADDIGGEVIQIQQEEAIIEEVVTAPPPPYVELETRAIAAGIGARVGNGVLLVNGQEHAFRVKGMTLGDFGISNIVGEGPVANLDNIEDFAGHYVAVEAGGALGKGASVLAMRNEHGVVITLDSTITGAQLTLGAQGLDIELQ